MFNEWAVELVSDSKGAKCTFNDPAKCSHSDLIDESDGLKLLAFLSCQSVLDAVDSAVLVVPTQGWTSHQSPASLPALAAVYPTGIIFSAEVQL